MPAALRRRRRAPSSGPWAQKKTPTAVDAFALNENENVRAFPALIMPVPVDIRGFSSTSPASPGLSRFLNYPVPLQKNLPMLYLPLCGKASIAQPDKHINLSQAPEFAAKRRGRNGTRSRRRTRRASIRRCLTGFSIHPLSYRPLFFSRTFLLLDRVLAGRL